MGPVRGGIALSLLPGIAWAEVCAEMRPGWDGMPTGMVEEAILLFTSPLALFLLGATAVVLFTRSQWGGLATTIGWTGLVSLISFLPDPVSDAARLEGCAGPTTLFIGLAIAICVGTTIYTTPRKSRD